MKRIKKEELLEEVNTPKEKKTKITEPRVGIEDR